MAIKKVWFDPEILSDDKLYVRTDFIADGASDISVLNASGSPYLNYPAGSTCFSAGSKKLYILNASRTEYVEVN